MMAMPTCPMILYLPRMPSEFLVVVEEADGAEAQGGAEHEQHVGAGEVAHEQAGDDDGEYDDDASHGRCAFFLFLSFQVEVADDFAHLHELQAADYGASDEYGHEQRQHECGAGAECEVVHQSGAGQPCVLKFLKEVV